MTIVGPLFWKELIETARRTRYYAARALVAAAVLTALLGMGQPLGKAQVDELAKLGRRLLEHWAWVQLGALVIFVPAFVSGLVAGEKDKKTLDALFTSPLTDGEILWGKLASRLYLTASIVASSLPVIVLLSFLGGFGPREVSYYALIQLATAIFCAAVGVYYSVVSTKPYVALIRAYFALLFVWLVLPLGVVGVAAIWSPRWLAAGTQPAMRLLAWLNPFLLMGAQSSVPVRGVAAWFPPALVYAVLSSIVSILLIRRSHRLLRVAANWHREPLLWRWLTRAFRDTVAGLSGALERRSDHRLWGRLWHWELKSRLWGSWERRYGLEINPLFYRRATANVYDPEHYVAGLQVLGWLVVLGFLLIGGYVWPELLGDTSNFRMLLWIELPALVLVVTILASSSIARERDRGSLDPLVLTSITSREMLAGTIWGVFRTAWPILALVLLTMVMGSVASLHEQALVVWVLTLPPMLASVTAGCLLISVVARRTPAAVAAGLAPPLFFVGGTYALETLQILHGPMGLFGVLVIVVVLLLGRLLGRRNSVTVATLLAIGVPLLCLMIAFWLNRVLSGADSDFWLSGTGSWSQQRRYWGGYRQPPSAWLDFNYARWLFGPIGHRWQNVYFTPTLAPVTFGIAQLLAAIWLLRLTLKNLDFMLGRTQWTLRRLSGPYSWEHGWRAGAEPVRILGLTRNERGYEGSVAVSAEGLRVGRQAAQSSLPFSVPDERRTYELEDRGS